MSSLLYRVFWSEINLSIYPLRGLPQTEVWIWERIATRLTWPRQPERGTWQSSVHLRAVCQEVIPVVAIRGIWPRYLVNDRIQAPAILHRQYPCLLRHKFLTHDFLGVRQIRSGLLRPKLYTNGLGWQQSWAFDNFSPIRYSLFRYFNTSFRYRYSATFLKIAISYSLFAIATFFSSVLLTASILGLYLR
jgi:hypothetical protein